MNDVPSAIESFLETAGITHSPQVFIMLSGLMFARLVSFINIVPFFGGASVPRQIKVATALAFTILLYPLTQTVPQDIKIGTANFIFLVIKEIGVGFTLGFIASFFFESIQIAGRLIDAQRGAMMAEMFAPQVQLQVSELGQFKLQFAIVLFLVSGAHRIFLSALFRSFEIMPITSFPKFTPGLSPTLIFIIDLSMQMLANAAQLAAPAIVVLLLTDIFFGLINRVAPQINVFFLSMPVKMLLGILVVLLAFPLYQRRYMYYLNDSIKSFEYFLRALSHMY